MARLYNACPKDILTELCEAAMTVRTIPPIGPSAQPAPGEAKAVLPAVPSLPVPSPSRGKVGTGR